MCVYVGAHIPQHRQRSEDRGQLEGSRLPSCGSRRLNPSYQALKQVLFYSLNHLTSPRH